MKAISLRQPWATLMALGIKHIENRSWRSSMRGPVLIHSSSWWHREEAEDDYDTAAHIMAKAGLGSMPLTVVEMKAVRGGVIGAFTITGCVERSDDPFFFGPYGFTVKNAVAFPTVIPCRGALGFFEVPDDVVEAARPFLEMTR